jgi:hypothetical protein
MATAVLHSPAFVGQRRPSLPALHHGSAATGKIACSLAHRGRARHAAATPRRRCPRPKHDEEGDGGGGVAS